MDTITRFHARCLGTVAAAESDLAAIVASGVFNPTLEKPYTALQKVKDDGSVETTYNRTTEMGADPPFPEGVIPSIPATSVVTVQIDMTRDNPADLWDVVRKINAVFPVSRYSSAVVISQDPAKGLQKMAFQADKMDA